MQKARAPQDPPLIPDFLAWTEGPARDPLAWVTRLGEAGLLEEALWSFKAHWKGRKAPSAIRAALESGAEAARTRRIHLWQQDPLRRTLRLRLEVTGPAARLHPPALQAALAQGLTGAGVPLALGLGKSPRPLVEWGHPLPPGVPGLSEWADITLREPLRGPLPEIQVEGLRILESREVPNYSSPVLDLCRIAHWRWTCPAELLVHARERLATFAEASSFEIDKVGKSEGRKVLKRIEVRHLVLDLSWEDLELRFSTRLSSGEAMNPQKLLAGILGVEASSVQPLVRERVELGDDPRLRQADRFQTKLHNIFEDAVMLEGGGNITLVDEDDDEPLKL